jgi:hypothetical protein
MKATIENTELRKELVNSHRGKYKIEVTFNGEGRCFYTNDTQLIDDAFNTDFDQDCEYFDSVNEARQAAIDTVFN